MASLSGSMDLTTKTFVSASNFMVIKFKTDGSVEKSGFRASWRTEAQTCGGDLVATPAPQILASPNYPRNYPGKKWLLYPWSLSYLDYRIVASRSTSWLVTCLGLFRLLMKGIFGPYVL